MSETNAIQQNAGSPDTNNAQMLGNGDYVIFSLSKSLYGIPSRAVREIVQLVEISPVDEAPDFIDGVINLRGSVIPVVNLDIHFGHPLHHYSLDDRIIVINDGHEALGILVDDVFDVQNIDTAKLEPVPEYQQGAESRERFITALARTEKGILMLMNPEHLLEYHADFKGMVAVEALSNVAEGRESGDETLFFPGATAEIREILHQRAQELSQVQESENLSDSIPLAVIELNHELFGVDLMLVQEFAEVEQINPVPCTPAYVIGNTNLRGNVLTVTDLRPLLQMPLADINGVEKLVIINAGGVTVALRVDEVHDVLYASLGSLTDLPTAVRSISDDYLMGSINYRDCIVSVIDMNGILDKGVLVIDEEP